MAKFHLLDLKMQQKLDGLGDPELQAFTKALNESADKAFTDTPTLGAIRVTFHFDIKDRNEDITYPAKLTLDIPKLLIRQMDDQFWDWYPADALIPARNGTLYLECFDGSRVLGFYKYDQFWITEPNGSISPLTSVARFAYVDVHLDQLNFVKGAS